MQTWFLLANVTYMLAGISIAPLLLTAHDERAAPKYALALSITLYAITPIATTNYQDNTMAQLVGLAAALTSCIASATAIVARLPTAVAVAAIVAHILMVAAALL